VATTLGSRDGVMNGWNEKLPTHRLTNTQREQGTGRHEENAKTKMIY
jgi:hypothetical protein